MRWKVIGEAKAQMDRVRFLRLSEATPMDHLIAHHQDILDAIVAQDTDAAEEAMKVHLRGILQSLPRLSRTFPDMFDEDEALPATATAKRESAR